MKANILLIFFLSSCAARPTVRVTSVPGTILPMQGIENIRYAENLKAYPLGRYVDPNNRGIMHEGHTIYRVESTNQWNLHPQPVGNVPGVTYRDAARIQAPARDELVMELNRQKEITKTIIQGNQAVSQKLGDLSSNVQQTRQVAEQNVRLEQDLKISKQRLDLLEAELQKHSSPTPSPIRKDEKSDW